MSHLLMIKCNPPLPKGETKGDFRRTGVHNLTMVGAIVIWKWLAERCMLM